MWSLIEVKQSYNREKRFEEAEMNSRQIMGLIVVVGLGAAILWAPWRAGAQDGDGEEAMWRRSDVATDGIELRLLSPPDSELAPKGAGEDVALLSPDGVVLRDLRLP